MLLPGLEGSTAAELLPSGYATSGPRMQVCLVGGKAIDGYEEQDEEDGEDSEPLGCSRLGGPSAENTRMRWALVTYNDAVIPGKDGELVELGYEVPAGGRVARDEDSKRDDGEGVHGTTDAPSRQARPGTCSRGSPGYRLRCCGYERQEKRINVGNSQRKGMQLLSRASGP